MDACVECGSIRLRVIGGSPLQRILALLLNQQVVVCGRCGWKGRLRRSRAGSSTRARTERRDDTRSSGSATNAGGVDLTAIDKALERDTDRTRKPGGGE